jgi:hypothetical protein
MPVLPPWVGVSTRDRMAEGPQRGEFGEM